MSHPAFRCEVHHGLPRWRIERMGDATVSWACDYHLAEVCQRLQRESERTKLVLTRFREIEAEYIESIAMMP